MSDLTIRCRFCWVLPGEPHVRGCPVPGVHLAPESEVVAEIAEKVETLRARLLEAWIRGSGPGPRGGYKPRDEEGLT